MFTGLIEDIGRVIEIGLHGNGARLKVGTSLPAEESSVGDSISVSGACLTLIGRGSGLYIMDVSAETLSVSTIGKMRHGQPVNLERALRADGRLGGHFVLGHVDGLCRLESVEKSGEGRKMTFSTDNNLLKYIVPKGSIAIDGVSLTVNTVSRDVFSVMLIPHSFEHTTLGQAKAGLELNTECDIIGKYVHAYLAGKKGGGITTETLERAGFLE